MLLLWFLLIVVRFLLVFDLLFILFRIALWPSAGKSRPICFSLVLFSFSAVLVVRVLFQFGVWDRVWNSIYRFLIIAFLSTSDVVMLLRKEFIYIILCAEICFIIIFFKMTVILKTSRQTKIIFKGFLHLKLL